MRRKYLRAPSLSHSLFLSGFECGGPPELHSGLRSVLHSGLKPPGSWSSKNHHREAKHDDSNVLRTPGCLAAQLELAGAPRPRRLYLLMIVSFDSSRLHSGHAMYKKSGFANAKGDGEKENAP